MKSEILFNAINKRQKIKFVYEFLPMEIEPYYLSINKNGNKVVYGRTNASNRIQAFEFNKIFNIKVLSKSKFSPIIPILSIYK